MTAVCRRLCTLPFLRPRVFLRSREKVEVIISLRAFPSAHSCNDKIFSAIVATPFARREEGIPPPAHKIAPLPDLAHLVECARRHPEINFVAAHCGGTAAGNIERLAKLSQGLDNVYADTSFRSHEDIELMIELLGREKIMFGTDYPFGSYKRQVEQVMIATEGDPELRKLVFFENANRLLHIV